MLESKSVTETGKTLFFDNSILGLIKVNVFFFQVKGMSAVGLDLLEKALVYDPTKRISAKRMLEHEYFDGFDKQMLVPSH